MTTFLFIGCAEDEFIKPNEEAINHTDDDSPVLEKINFNQFINQSYFSEVQKQGSFDNATHSTDSTSYYNVSLETINQVSKDQTISYTFLIKGKMNESSAFENFMIKEDPNGDLSYYIIAYTKNNASGSSYPYSAVTKPIDESDVDYTTNAIKLKVMPIDEGGGGSGDEDLPSSSVGSPYYPYNCDGTVIMYYATVSLCNCCNHLPSECNGCDKGWHDVVVPYYYCESHDDGGGNNGGGNDGGSGDGNDGGTPPASGGGDQDESPTITSPNHNLTPQDPEECPDLEGDLDGNCSIDDFEMFVLNLAPEQADWWHNQASSTQKTEIKAFLENNKESGSYTQEAKEFVGEAIQLLLNSLSAVGSFETNNYPGINEGHPFKWWEDVNYISSNFTIFEPSPNAYELLLFALFPAAAIAHSENSIEALNRALELCENGSLCDESLSGIEDGKADAFRHSYWNALGTAEFGDAVMKLFADAHEWGEDGLSVEMDLFNNEAGRNISLNFSFSDTDELIAFFVLEALNNGELRYINDGVLIPTNE